MDSIGRLRSIIINVLNNGDQQVSMQELFDGLRTHKSQLLNILDVGRRDSAHQRELESGKTVIGGKSVAVNADFAKQTIFLSQQLDCSERYIAEIVQKVMSDNPNVDSVTCIELCVDEFHSRRRQLIDCLRGLLEVADQADQGGPSSIYGMIDEFVKDELVPPVILAGATGGETTLAQRMFRELENLGSVIASADIARNNARTQGIAPGGQQPAALGLDILTARFQSLLHERRNLAICFHLLARLGYLTPQEHKQNIDWLSNHPNHPITYYMLSTALISLEVGDIETVRGRSRNKLAHDAGTVSYMKQKLAPTTLWKDEGLKAVLLMKWALYLTEVRHQKPAVYENREGFSGEELESHIRNAILGDAFTFLSLALLQLHNRHDIASQPSLFYALSVPTEQKEQRTVPEDDFKPTLLYTFRDLILSLITYASSELRKIKQRQEDIVLAGGRNDRKRGPNIRFSSSSAPSTEKPRNDVATLFSFIGILYTNLPPESALQFWGAGPQVQAPQASYIEYLETTAGRLPAFLQWAVWSTQLQDRTMATALYDMIAGLANGEQCSELAYNFLARGGNEVIPGSTVPASSASAVSWSVVFNTLENWAVNVANSKPNPVPQSLNGLNGTTTLGQSTYQRPQQQYEIGAEDVLFSQSFLRLLRTVVTHSVSVRLAIAGHTHFKAVPALLTLVPLPVPLELKGALFETLAALCEPGAGTPGIEICKAIWLIMEKLEVINVRPGGVAGTIGHIKKGVEVELEEVEAVHGLYPATIPFLKLLATLLHTPKRVNVKDQISDGGAINTIPDFLGQPYRLPGIGPYLNFVVDNVFAKLPLREYVHPSDRWQLNDLCLSFIERSLASYDLESLLAAAEEGQVKNEMIGPLVTHPGYEIVKRLLTNSSLQNSILTYVVEGLDGFEKGLAKEEPFFRNTIVRVLRIILRTLEIQDIYLDILVPLLPEVDSAPMLGATINQRSFFTKLDKALSFGPQSASAIAAYVSYPAYSELALLSIKILNLLSSSNAFPNLAALVERSQESERILAGFIQILSSESLDDVQQADEVAEQVTGAGAPDLDSPPILDQAVRFAALELFIRNTSSSRPCPNLAHFLLSGSTSPGQPIQDPHALGARMTCIHVILQLLNNGVPRRGSSGREMESSVGMPLFMVLPALAERCYKILHQLCVHPRTTDSSMRYLRTREDFFLRHLSAVPIHVPENMREPYVQMLYNDGSRVTTTVASVTAFLNLRSTILDLVALELHVLTKQGLHSGIADLLEVLFDNDSTYDEPAAWEDELSRPFREMGQSSMKIIELVQSLTFDWADSLSIQTCELQFFKQLNINNCIRRDAMGCEIIDRATLLSLLADARRMLHSQNAIVTPTHLEQLNTETTYILQSCAIENHRRQIVHATTSGFEAWRRTLETTLTECFERLPYDRRESMLFDLLHVLPAILRSPTTTEPTSVLISQVILSSITKLRIDRVRQIIFQAAAGDPESGALPAERLYSILRGILESILDNNRSEFVRGNLYASLVNYFHLIIFHANPESPSGALSSNDLQMSMSFARSSLAESTSALVPRSVGHIDSANTALLLNSLTIMKPHMERIVTTIARDAIDGTEVWKTIAFMVLDSLIRVSGLEKNHVVLSHLAKHGILLNFAQGIQDSDVLLQSVLKPDPDDLNPLYVYESKMSLFIRMAQTKAGAERLLESNLIASLSQCDYIDARPENDQDFIDHGTFLPSAIQRYHQLFMPSLQLLNAILFTLGSRHVVASNQALKFLTSHSATISILLKTDFEDVSIAFLDEVHLLVSLCINTLPLVPKAEVAAVNSGFGSIHSAILGLCTRCLGDDRWLDSIKPQTDAELSDSRTPATGFADESIFEVKIRYKHEILVEALIAYLGAASEFTEPELNAILSPLTSTPRHDERGSHFLASIPSIGDALEALNNLGNNLAQTMKQMAEIAAELTAKQQISVENILQTVRGVDSEFLRHLDVAQKRTLICRELESLQNSVRKDAKIILNTTEMILLLLWRHLTHYSDDQFTRSTNLRGSTTAAMRLLSAPDPEALRVEVGKKLNPILQRLQSFELDFAKGSVEYIEIMSRRLRDAAGLHQSSISENNMNADS